MRINIETIKGSNMYTDIDGLFLGGIWINKDEFNIEDNKIYVIEYETSIIESGNGMAINHNKIIRCREVPIMENCNGHLGLNKIDMIDQYLLDNFELVSGGCSSIMNSKYGLSRRILERLWINNDKLSLD